MTLRKRLAGAFWFAVHNAIAHPLLLTHTALAWRFHDWTADRMSADDPLLLSADERILWGLVANAGRLSAYRAPRWFHVGQAAGEGSTVARALCRRFSFDPDEATGGLNR